MVGAAAGRETTMSHIFLSYSRSDGGYVDKLSVAIESVGVRVWVDRRGLRGGDQWREEIVRAIKTADLFMLVLSPNSARSDNVRKELDIAEGAKRPILPVAIAPTKIPSAMEYQLVGIQIVELWRDSRRAGEWLLKAMSAYKLPGLQTGRTPNLPERTAPDAGSGVNLADFGGGDLIDKLKIGKLFGQK